MMQQQQAHKQARDTPQYKLAQVKVRDNQEWSRGDEDVLPKFLPFERKYVSVGAVWRHNAPQEATRDTVFSSRPHTMRDAVIPLLVPLEAAIEPLQTRLGQSPQLNWRLPTTPRSFTTMDYGSAVTSTV